MTTDSSSKLRLIPVAIFLIIAGFFAVALRSGDPSRLPSTLIGKSAPEAAFPGLDGLLSEGKTVPGFATADLAKGKVSIVNFWASWCTECVDEHPLVAELKTLTGVDVYGVAYKDSAVASRRFLGRYGNPFTAVGADDSGRRGIDWGVYGTPETFVVNGRGEIVFKHVGPMSPESIKLKMLPAIEAAKSGIAQKG